MAYRESSYASGVLDYYLFTKNLQGDILNIYDTNGKTGEDNPPSPVLCLHPVYMSPYLTLKEL